MDDVDSLRLAILGITGQPLTNSFDWVADILVLLILIFINGFFSAAEFSIVSLNNNKIKKRAEDGDRVAKRLFDLVSNPSRFLATIQVGVTFAGFLSSALASDKFAMRLWLILDPNKMHSWLYSLSMVIITLVLAYFSLVLGELIPKRLALINPEGMSAKIVGIINFFNLILLPFTKLLTISTNTILKLLGLNPDYREAAITEEELRLMLEASNETGNIEMSEKMMIDNIFEFNDTTTSEIMTHRTNVEAIPLSSDLDMAIHACCDEKYSRIPVYDENIDDIVGVLHVKDMLTFMAKSQNPQADFNLKNLMRQPYFTPESKSIDALFRGMQKEHVQMAIVIDEYGGTAGIITIEDILEEIVGNIQDEYDEETAEIISNADGSYLIDGMVDPEDVAEQVKWFIFDSEENDDFDTMGGYVIHLLDRIPDENEFPEVRDGDVLFKVKEMDEKRISKILMVHEPSEVLATEGQEV